MLSIEHKVKKRIVPLQSTLARITPGQGSNTIVYGRDTLPVCWRSNIPFLGLLYHDLAHDPRCQNRSGNGQRT